MKSNSWFSSRHYAVPVVAAIALLAILVNELDRAISAMHVSGSIDALWINRIGVTLLTLMGAVGLGFYIRHLLLYDRERERRERDLVTQVRERTEELRELAAHLLTAREDEKAHLARELHDELGAVLTAAKLDMARMRKRLAEAPGAQDIIERVMARLNEGIALKRRIVEDLRPSSLDLLGLNASIGSLCLDMGQRLGIPITTDLVPVGLSADGKLAVYRMVQEGLTNVGKYAQAASVRVTIAKDAQQVRVRVDDDGVGFAQAAGKPGAHGIAGMRLRFEALNGSMSIQSSPGTGTRLEATLPWQGESLAPVSQLPDAVGETVARSARNEAAARPVVRPPPAPR